MLNNIAISIKMGQTVILNINVLSVQDRVIGAKNEWGNVGELIVSKYMKLYKVLNNIEILVHN